MHGNGGGMASKGLRAITYQITRNVDAGDELRIPLKPLLAIPRVTASIFLFLFLSH